MGLTGEVNWWATPLGGCPRSLAFGDRGWKTGRPFILVSGGAHRLTYLRSADGRLDRRVRPLPGHPAARSNEIPHACAGPPVLPFTPPVAHSVYTYRIHVPYATSQESPAENYPLQKTPRSFADN